MVGILLTNFSLWGYVKNRVYSQVINGIDDLKEKIKEAFASIPLSMLANVFDGFKRRLEDCELLGGAQVEVCRKRNCANCNR